jgi:hypothetical protein
VGAHATLKYHYPYRRFTYCIKLSLSVRTVLDLRREFIPVDSCARHSQVGSLAGAAHLLKDNAGVPRLAQ